GDVLFGLGRLDDAEAALADALAHDAPTNTRVAALTMLGTLRMAQERADEAEPLLLEAIALVEREAGSSSSDLARPLNMLGVTRIQRGQARAGIVALERAAQVLAARHGEHHALVGYALGNLAVAHGALGEHELAYRRLLEVLEIFEHASDVDDNRIAITLQNLANQALMCGRPADALRHVEREIAIITADEVPDGEDSMGTWSLLARARRGVGDFRGSLAAWDDLLARRHAITPRYDDALGWAELETAITAQQAGDVTLAREHIARALTHYGRSDETSPREHARVRIVAARLADDRDEAVAHLHAAWTHLAASTEARESAMRLELFDTWSQLGGPKLAPWDAITTR
ncbi:MAG TPA: tetratricopeptide repeat protein, partial [Nannocystaceae bacterium]|nr:tetratricopeptide repeat protein [Nannocystaceae bacterium]